MGPERLNQTLPTGHTGDSGSGTKVTVLGPFWCPSPTPPHLCPVLHQLSTAGDLGTLAAAALSLQHLTWVDPELVRAVPGSWVMSPCGALTGWEGEEPHISSSRAHALAPCHDVPTFQVHIPTPSMGVRFQHVNSEELNIPPWEAVYADLDARVSLEWRHKPVTLVLSGRIIWNPSLRPT